ncbi:hypothetical protein [Listeria cornellensis]|uniref:Uncharacterized protein n=1 Tax=Listeria cornellensis FSL F6-0969 TaxID=1265820 RepID=W7BVK2_9LIST|nr:hypothetical protein [Listeria cornellensis]EUJ27336.1 hypothetical protein PCORN_13442 [Listeria cornellensis FSL F6-0969]
MIDVHDEDAIEFKQCNDKYCSLCRNIEKKQSELNKSFNGIADTKPDTSLEGLTRSEKTKVIRLRLDAKNEEDYFELRDEGLIDKLIAQEWQVPSGSLARWKQSNNIVTKAMQLDISVADYNDMRDQGLSDSAIAMTLDVDISDVSCFKRKNGIKNERVSKYFRRSGHATKISK